MHMIRPIPRPPAHDPLTRTEHHPPRPPGPVSEPLVQADLRWCPITVRRPGHPRPERMRVLARSRRQALELALDAYPDAVITG